MNRAERVLAVAAHADDEILGAGGALAEHTFAGHPGMLLILSASATSRPGPDSSEVQAHRSECSRKVAALYGAELVLQDFTDNAFDTVPRLRITQAIEDVVRSWQPTIVYSHSVADLSQDHQIVAAATAAATRPQPGSSVRTVLAWEVRSATEWGINRPFRPTWFQPLSPEAVALRRQALDVYGSEMRKWPHTRSPEALDAELLTRGSQIGVETAEAFEVMRHHHVLTAQRE
ncbi:PIG-L family deacetylase [Streptomyces sp. NPDC001795]|uniref:PIG-L deacetylase family protein n=1 Tax=Streptomyces sp. NPDC001795 TaxID=3154525 RepID=UPI003327EE84